MKLHLRSLQVSQGLLTVAAMGLCTAQGALAQDAKKTAWGEPDIAGSYSEFTLAPLERPEELGTQEFFTPDEAREYQTRVLDAANQDDETEPGTQEDVHYDFGTFALSANEGKTSENFRTSIITFPANGRIPPLTAEATARRDARAEARRGKEFDGPEMRSLTERCIVWSSTLPPILPGGYNSNLQIFQSPGYVVIQGEMGDPRVIPTDGRALPEPLLPQWSGTSVGKWEGDTLVVETAGFHPTTAWRNASENMKVTERLTRVDDDTVEYSFRVEDPSTWAEPWGGTYPLTDLGGVLFEYACTEGNYGMANILSGQRAADREAAQASAQAQ
ncbi:MAG: hypothetical protein RLZZ227_2421 [Pseudomonadota bacterium]|jgi:hypothetical protein